MGDQVEELRAIVDISVVPGAHREVHDFLKKKTYVEQVMISFGKPDLNAIVRSKDLRHLAQLLDEITRHPKIASTATRILLPEER